MLVVKILSTLEVFGLNCAAGQKTKGKQATDEAYRVRVAFHERLTLRELPTMLDQWGIQVTLLQPDSFNPYLRTR